MKPEDIQHGGSHYKNMPKHLQPIYLATALGLNPMEYSVLKYLLRHRKKGGLLDLKKMMHFGQMLLEQEYNSATEIIYLDEPIDAEFEIVPPADPPQVECPFRVGDIIQHNMDIEDQAGVKWQIVGITSERLSALNFNDHNDASHIEQRFWRNYSRVGTAAAEVKEQSGCPFKVGDVIQFHDAAVSKTQWQIDRILSDRLHVISHDPYQTPSQIDRQFWGNYRIVAPTTLDATQQTC